jgi:hypothetical protein
MEKAKPFKQKIATLEKLYKSGYTTKRELSHLTLERLDTVKDINVNDVSTIAEIKKSIRDGNLFAYLGEEWADKEDETDDGTKSR